MAAEITERLDPDAVDNKTLLELVETLPSGSNNPMLSPSTMYNPHPHSVPLQDKGYSLNSSTYVSPSQLFPAPKAGLQKGTTKTRKRGRTLILTHPQSRC